MADFSPLTSKAVSGLFFDAFENQSQMALANKIAFIRTGSTQANELYKNPVITKGMSQLEGALKLDPAPVVSYTLSNVQFADAIDIDINDWKFDNTGTVQRLISEKASIAAFHNDSLISTLLDNGASNNDQYGVPFFGSHTVGSVTQTNVVTYNATTANDPTASEIAVLLSNMLAKMYGLKNGAGYPVNAGARSFAFVYPTNWLNTIAAVSASLLPNGASVQENPVAAWQEGRYNVGKINVVPVLNPFLTGDDSAYLCRLDGESTRPFIVQIRDPLTIQELTEGSTDAVYRHRYVFALKENKNCGYMNFMHCIKGQMT